MLVCLSRLFIRRCEIVDAFNWGSGDVWIPSYIREDYTGLKRSVAVVYYKGGTVSSGFRDLTIPCENFSLPPTTFQPVILLDWTGVDLTPKSTPYAEEAVELQDSNMTPDQIYTINSKSWQKMRKKVRKENVPNQH